MAFTKKSLYSAMALAMLTGAVIAPVTQITPNSVVRAETVATRPQKTTVNVYKLQAKDYAENLKWDGIPNENGEKLSAEQIAKLGTDVTTLDGVTFRAYKVKDQSLSNDVVKSYATKAKADAANDKLEFVSEVTTANGGLATFNLDSRTYERYLFVESNAPETVSSGIAVPFVLTLPISNSKGTGFENEVNVYPKNISGEKPSVGKDVNTLGNNAIGAEIGKDLTFFLKGTIPTNIQDYTQYQFNDTLDTQLTFVSTPEQVTVKYGTRSLTYNMDYSVDIVGQLLTVKLTETGINKIAKDVSLGKRNTPDSTTIADINQNTDDKPFVQVEFKAEINDTAILGKDILNKTTITYKNNGNQTGNPKADPNNPPTPDNPPKETPPSDETKVYTGGKRFVKVEAGNNNQKLEGAEFALFSEVNAQTPIKWTTELLKANKKGIDSNQFVNPKENDPIILKSVTEGMFEIKGLSYGSEGQTAGQGTSTYYLKETKAPAGYVIPEAPIEFTVNQTSYNKTPTTIDINKADADPQEITNTKRPEIPNTGGIGTAIFVVLGIVLMVVAAKGMRSHKEEN